MIAQIFINLVTKAQKPKIAVIRGTACVDRIDFRKIRQGEKMPIDKDSVSSMKEDTILHVRQHEGSETIQVVLKYPVVGDPYLIKK